MDAFTTRTLTSSHFECPVVKLIHSKIEKESHTVDDIRKGHEFFVSSLGTSYSAPDLSADVEVRRREAHTDKKMGNRQNDKRSSHRNSTSNHHFYATR